MGIERGGKRASDHVAKVVVKRQPVAAQEEEERARVDVTIVGDDIEHARVEPLRPFVFVGPLRRLLVRQSFVPECQQL